MPFAIGLAIARFVRRMTTDSNVATAVGAGGALVVVLLLFGNAFIELDRMHAACRAAGGYCPVFPGDLRRYTAIGLLGFGAIAVLHVVMLTLEERQRRQTHSL